MEAPLPKQVPPARAKRRSIPFADIVALVGRDDATILEVGANRGTHTLEFLKAFPRATLHAFEPDARAIGHWRRNVTDPRARLYEMAVGRSDGTVSFYKSSGKEDVDPAGWDQSGSIRAPKTHLTKWPKVRFEEVVEVPIVRLDSWIADKGIATVDFIWADVQGAEEDLILGAAETLKRTRFFYTEYSDDEWYEGQITLDGILALLPEFEVVERLRHDVLLRRRWS